MSPIEWFDLDFFTGITTNEFNLIHNGRFLTDGKQRLSEVPIEDGDAILVYRLPPDAQCGAIQNAAHGAAIPDVASTESGAGAASESPDGGLSAEFAALPEDRRRRLIQEAAALREALLSRPEEVATLQGKNPILADALVTGRQSG